MKELRLVEAEKLSDRQKEIFSEVSKLASDLHDEILNRITLTIDKLEPISDQEIDTLAINTLVHIHALNAAVLSELDISMQSPLETANTINTLACNSLKTTIN